MVQATPRVHLELDSSARHRLHVLDQGAGKSQSEGLGLTGRLAVLFVTVFFVASVVRHFELSPVRWMSAKSPERATLTL